MKSNTPDLMKFKRLQRHLGESTRGVVGLLEMLWIGTAKNTPRGDIGRFTNEEIAIMVDWVGDADALVAALVECGWLDEHNECRLVVHDWELHAPQFVKGNVTRHLGGFVKPSPKERPQGTVPRGPSQGASPEDSPSKPSLVKPSQAKPSQEECSEVSRPSPPPSECKYPCFPCVQGRLTKEQSWTLGSDVVERFSECFPAVNVEAEARKAHTWILAKPSRRKTAGGMEDFLRRWIAKEQDSGRVSVGSEPAASRIPPLESLKDWRPS